LENGYEKRLNFFRGIGVCLFLFFVVGDGIDGMRRRVGI
jgi:hypothetical protein